MHVCVMILATINRVQWTSWNKQAHCQFSSQRGNRKEQVDVGLMHRTSEV